MTKKKDPSELKTRGRKETVHENHDIRSHLAGVRYLNQLTAAAREVIDSEMKAMTEKKKSKKGVQNVHILRLITRLGEIKRVTVKKVLDESEDFDNNDYSDSRVTEFKSMLINISVRLSKLLEEGTPIRTDVEGAEDQFDGIELYNLQRLLETGASKTKVLEFMQSITNPN